MTVLLDTSVLIDFLRGHNEAVKFVGGLDEPAISSEICRVGVLQGLRSSEERLAAELFELIEWIPVIEPISTRAGALGRQWRPSHSGIDTADLIIAATAELTDASLQTLNVKRFPMIDALRAPY